jgi:hypothetical protein
MATTVEPRTPTVLDEIGEAELVLDLCADDLFVDTTVQRPTDEERAYEIAQDLQFPAIRTLVVSDRGPNAPRGKRYHVVDGGHRRMALILAGHGSRKLRVEKYENLTKRQEAELFELLNKAKQVDYLTMFRVRVIKGDPTAIALDKILKRRGLRIGPASSKQVFAAVQTLESIYTEHLKMYPEDTEPNSAELVLALLQETWPECPQAYARAIVRGFGHLVLRYLPDLEPDAVPGKVRKEFGPAKDGIGPAELLARANGRRASSVKVNMGEAVFQLLVECYNWRRGARSLPPIVKRTGRAPKYVDA